MERVVEHVHRKRVNETRQSCQKRKNKVEIRGQRGRKKGGGGVKRTQELAVGGET